LSSFGTRQGFYHGFGRSFNANLGKVAYHPALGPPSGLSATGRTGNLL
jgi:hypothetical protein